MERQKVTLSVPKVLLKKARILAAQEEKSLSELMREALEHRVTQAIRYQQARRWHTLLIRQGLYLGTQGRLQKQ